MPETTTAARSGPRRTRRGPARSPGLPLPAVLAGLAAVLAATVAASLVIGAEDLTAAQVFAALFGDDADRQAHLLVFEYRIPRTLVAIAAGAALGVAGALIQAYTRNPLADPGILGVNAGAAFGVTVAFGLGLSASTSALVLPALVGACAATVAVLLLASIGRGPATPVRMTLAGVALAAVIGGVTTGIRLSDPDTFERLRSWQAGSVAGRSLADLAEVAPYLGAGLALAVLLVKPLNAIALGEDLAASLGVNTRNVQVLTVVAVALLVGAATAVAGPIGFIGLMVPHACRLLVGNDHTRIIPMSALAAPVIILLADVVSRVLLPLRELPVGVVTAFIGAPVLVWVVRSRKAGAQ